MFPALTFCALAEFWQSSELNSHIGMLTTLTTLTMLIVQMQLFEVILSLSLLLASEKPVSASGSVAQFGSVSLSVLEHKSLILVTLHRYFGIIIDPDCFNHTLKPGLRYAAPTS